MTAKDEASLRDAAPLIPADTPMAVTFLPGEDAAARVAATVAVRELGFEPMPHFSARRITSEDDFEGYLRAVVEQAGVSAASSSRAIRPSRKARISIPWR
jgi:methylenetetrahydrofolate reductase (NADPH)